MFMIFQSASLTSQSEVEVSVLTIVMFLLTASRKSLGFSMAILSLMVICTDASKAQYCYSSASEPSSFCLALTQSQNDTTGGIDLYMAISALPTSRGGGWMGIGTGDVMAGSLMFLLWADAERDNLIVSVRTTSAHTEPFHSRNMPVTEVLRARASKDGHHEALLVCRSCHEWDGLDLHSKAFPWMWASNYYAQLPSHPEAHLGDHQLHDSFYVNMKATVAPTSPPVFPSIEGSTRLNAWDGKKLSASHPQNFHQGFWHGVTMVVAFMGIMMLSATYKRWGSSTMVHLVGQCVGLAVFIVGLTFGLLSAKAGGSSTMSHQFVGLAVSAGMLTQVFSGGQILVLKQWRITLSPTILKLHRWLGRAVLLGGIANTGFGLYEARAGLRNLAVWLSLALVEGALYWYVGWAKKSKALERGRWMPVDQTSREDKEADEDARSSLDLSDLVQE
jgi:hypothetical protein